MRCACAGNKRSFWYVAAYFGKLPSRVAATMSSSKALRVRKELLRLAVEALFADYRNEGVDNPALVGERFRDAYGTTRHVFVRFQNLIFDLPVVHAWTLTLANQVRSPPGTQSTQRTQSPANAHTRHAVTRTPSKWALCWRHM